MAPSRQPQPAPATSSRSNPQEPANDTKSKKKRVEPISSLAPRRPDEIEEAESVVPTPKPKLTRVESSDEEDQEGDDDDVESVYLSDDERSDDQDTTSEEDSDDSDDSVESLPPRQLTRRSTGRAVKHPSPSSPFTVVQTRSETTHWITTQQPQGNNRAVTRGTRTIQQQTTMHGQNLNTQQQRRSSGNSLRLNMSIDVNMSFSGLVTGRNLSFAGIQGQLSYGWSRRNTQGS
ncbi:Hypothetical protein NCS54_00561400 [Fusarium falciforme]|uniref:Hypothetical protein n=1 Tax=Fusarium falciforme TaxID=195108 RepID=UPI0023010CC1|nr:Hypothetical protein NCS54_00561400 [Fusarium falciforme]WAO88275.1 Hypothetical protein NCS54_00561400 [Fusarium falciforme]